MGGRPSLAADDPKVEEAKKLSKDFTLAIDEICKRLNVSKSTYYRYLSK
jgi:hypothetical protein